MAGSFVLVMMVADVELRCWPRLENCCMLAVLVSKDGWAERGGMIIIIINIKLVGWLEKLSYCAVGNDRVVLTVSCPVVDMYR